MWEIAALRGRSCEIDFDDEDIYVRRRDGEERKMTFSTFNDLYLILNECLDVALAEDCIFYRVVDGEVILRNRFGQTKTISMDTFLRMYTI